MIRRRVLSFNAPHAVRIIRTELETNDGESELVLRVSGVEPANKGRVAEIRYLVKSKSKELEAQGRQDLAELLRAVGKHKLPDHEELLGCVFRVTMRLKATALHGKDDHG